MGIGVAYHHVSKHSTVVDGDTNAKGITVWIDHRLNLSERVRSAGDILLRNAVLPYPSERCEVAIESVRVSAG